MHATGPSGRESSRTVRLTFPEFKSWMASHRVIFVEHVLFLCRGSREKEIIAAQQHHKKP